MSKFYVTTPIYYVNARPHIGHAYSTIVADVIARHHRLLGDDVFFLTGTDEHGLKIERSAAAAGFTPQQFANEVSSSFQRLWERMGITYDAFIRTTDAHHKKGVQKLFTALQERGYIYLDEYRGHYCVGCEAFVDDVASDSFNPFGGGRLCATCGRKTELTTEQNYFFKLTAFTDQIIALIDSNEFVIEPEPRRNEVLSFLRSGVRDLSISRSSFNWGVPVPGDPKHIIYVWLDALANYLTAVGYGGDSSSEAAMFERYWPADQHIVGKEITRFHCIYWPAFLLAAGLPLPKRVTAHGWLLFDNDKMSKSKGNIVRTEAVLDAFGEVWAKQYPESTKTDQDLFASDVLRYYLLRRVPFGNDGNFSTEDIVKTYNSELANGYGNFVSRTFSMVQKFLGGKVPGDLQQWLPSQTELNLQKDLEDIQASIHMSDRILTSEEPWKLAKLGDDKSQEHLKDVLFSALRNILRITIRLHPYMPYTTNLVYSYFGVGRIGDSVAEWPDHLVGVVSISSRKSVLGSFPQDGLAKFRNLLYDPFSSLNFGVENNIPPIYPRATDVKVE